MAWQRANRSVPLRAELAHDARRIDLQRARDRQELDHVDAALAAFVLGDEALRLAEAISELLLGERAFSRAATSNSIRCTCSGDRSDFKTSGSLRARV